MSKDNIVNPDNLRFFASQLECGTMDRTTDRYIAARIRDAADKIERLHLATAALVKIVYDDWPGDMALRAIAEMIAAPPSAKEQDALVEAELYAKGYSQRPWLENQQRKD